MVFKISKIFFAAFVFLISINTNAQNSFVLSGIVKDVTTGEGLPGVSIFEESTKIGTVTNENGYYSLELKTGEHQLTFRFIGYEKFYKTVLIEKDLQMNVEMTYSIQQINEVVVSAEKPDENVTSTETSIEKLDIQQIKLYKSNSGLGANSNRYCFYLSILLCEK